MSLTDTILDQIDAYQMEQLDAETNVIKAHMEACMRDINIHMECERAGIIMESDDWDGKIIPDPGDENIFKYIFLFIPRIIINICKKIKAWWNNKKQAALDAEVEKIDKESLEIIYRDANKICSAINNAIPGGGHLQYTGTDFVYMSRLRGVGSIIDIYQMFEQRFLNYKNCVSSFIESTENGTKVNPFATGDYINAELESGAPTIGDLCSDEYNSSISSKGFIDIFPKIKKNVEKLANNTIRAMEDVEMLYTDIISHPDMIEANRSLVTRYMKIVEKVYDVFVRFNSVVMEDLGNAFLAFKQKNKMIIKLRNEYLKHPETVTAKKDLEEKLDKWGVK